MPQEERDEKREQARATLHPSLRDTFDRLLEDYEVSAQIHVGDGSVNYNIIADLVRAGWRHVLPWWPRAPPRSHRRGPPIGGLVLATFSSWSASASSSRAICSTRPVTLVVVASLASAWPR